MSRIRRWKLQKTVYDYSNETRWDGPDFADGEVIEVVEARSTIYGVWEQNREGVGDPDTLIALFWDENDAKERAAEAPVYNVGSRFAEQAHWFIEEHEIA